jgi:hypothetical protein
MIQSKLIGGDGVVICGNCGQENAEGSTFCTQCNSFLEWTGQRVTTQRPDTAPQSVGPAVPPGPQVVSSSTPSQGRPRNPGQAVKTSLSQGVQSVEPGGQVVFTLDVRNVSEVVDELTIELLGDAAAWAEVQPQSLRLMPDTSGVATIRIRPPRGPQVRSGWVNFGVGIRSKEFPDASVVERGAIDVASFVELAVDLSPRVARGQRAAAFTVRARNDGNLPIRLALSADDPEQAIDFEFTPSPLQVEPGAAKVSSLRARARQTFWLGTSRSRPFQVTVAPSDQPVRTLDGTFIQRGIIPLWLLPLIVGVVAVAIVALLIGGGRPTPTASPSESNVTPSGPTATASEPTPTPSEPTPTPSEPTPTPSEPTVPPATFGMPILIEPADGTVFNNFPRTTTVRWNPVADAVAYRVEYQYFDTDWRPWGSADVTTTEHTFEFVGAQPGRWRVAAIDAAGQLSEFSDWWGFTYTV